MAEPVSIKRQKLPPSFVFVYLACGIMGNVFPVVLPIMPFLFLVPFYKIQQIRFDKKDISQIRLITMGIHLVLIAAAIAIPHVVFLQAFSVGWHICSIGFYQLYFKALNKDPVQKRVYQLMKLAVFCFVALWGLILVDYLFFEQTIRLSLIDAVELQAKGLRDVLLENKLSPYQLPSSIRFLLGQGPRSWSEMIVDQLPTGIFGFLMLTFYLYWSLYDLKFIAEKARMYLLYRVPDWAMIVVVCWLIIAMTGYTLERMNVNETMALPTQLPLFLKQGGIIGFISTLWWYAFEGVSILVRKGFIVRKFWVFFLLITVMFFNMQVAAMMLMALGLLAQIRRFMPQKSKKG